MSRIEIVPSSSVTAEARTAFYQRTFTDRWRLLAEHWRWWYRAGFQSGIEPLLAVDSGAVVGQAGVIPALLRVAGTPRRAQWYVDFAVLPEYQGKGLGQRLTQAWMQLGETYITHCNDKSMGVFRKYGFLERQDCVRYARPIHPGAMLAGHSSMGVRLGSRLFDPLPWLWANASWQRAPRLAPIAIQPEILATFFRSSSGSACELVRDADWARWRLYESPFREEYAAFSHDGAHGIARRFTYGGVRRVHVLWLSAGNAPEHRQLVRGIGRWALSVGADLFWATANSATLGAALEHSLPFEKRFRFAYLSRDRQTFDQLAHNPLELQAIDSDTDSMYA